MNPRAALHDTLSALDPAEERFASRFVQALLDAGCDAGASDLHLLPTADGMRVGWRIDGVLHPIGTFSRAAQPNVIARLKVLADLLTYQTEAPQEGRIRESPQGVEMRVSTFPTIYGEKAVVRLFAATGQRFQSLADVALPARIEQRLRLLLAETSGAIVVAGPAGSGKTTTAYACLHEIVAGSETGRSIVSLEDPVESVIAGVAQSQVNEAAGFTLAAGLRSLMRQDPEVILVGEIRDRATAEAALGAALTGQLVVTTFHAPAAASAVCRLSDMGIEPYVLRSGVLAIIAQRLVRRLCDCAAPDQSEEARLGLPVQQYRLPTGCDACHGSGYCGRFVLAEMLEITSHGMAQAVLARESAGTLQKLAVEHGMTPLMDRAVEAVAQGRTSPAEVRRVLGFARHE